MLHPASSGQCIAQPLGAFGLTTARPYDFLDGNSRTNQDIFKFFSNVRKVTCDNCSRMGPKVDLKLPLFQSFKHASG